MAITDHEALLAQYRTLPTLRRRAIAAQASPELRARLLVVEKRLAMDRSPGALAAVLTDGREMQAPHLDLIDKAFIDMAEGRLDRVMLTMPPRHGKSRRASRWAPLWYLRRNPGHRMMIASYSSDLADDHGRWIRDAIITWGDELGIHLKTGSSAANRFDIAAWRRRTPRRGHRRRPHRPRRPHRHRGRPRQGHGRRGQPDHAQKGVGLVDLRPPDPNRTHRGDLRHPDPLARRRPGRSHPRDRTGRLARHRPARSRRQPRRPPRSPPWPAPLARAIRHHPSRQDPQARRRTSMGSPLHAEAAPTRGRRLEAEVDRRRPHQRRPVFRPRHGADRRRRRPHAAATPP